MDPEKDTKRFIDTTNPKAREKVLYLWPEFNLIDIWREFNFETESYSSRTNNFSKKSRLDLYHEYFFLNVLESKIYSGFRSDHSIVCLSLKGEAMKRYKLFWKFNNSLLKDNKYMEEINKVMKDTKIMYDKSDWNIIT